MARPGYLAAVKGSYELIFVPLQKEKPVGVLLWYGGHYILLPALAFGMFVNWIQSLYLVIQHINVFAGLEYQLLGTLILEVSDSVNHAEAALAKDRSDLESIL